MKQQIKFNCSRNRGELGTPIKCFERGVWYDYFPETSEAVDLMGVTRKVHLDPAHENHRILGWSIR